MNPSGERAVLDGMLTRCSFPDAGTEVDCAVSGGPDSLALLVLAVHAGCRVTAWHVDHGLREGSAAEADVVADAARRWGAAFESRQVLVAAGPNLEERARTARYGVLPADVLTGHTADDQAETVLLNLIRGAGLDGLAGIRPERRPLLGLRRRDTAELCRVLRLDPIRDPSNADLRLRRNRVRLELLPLLDDVAERDVVPLVARAAGHLRETGDLLEDLAARLDPVDAKALAAAPAPLAGRAVRRWVRQVTGMSHPPSAAAVARVLEVARGEAKAAEIGGGWRVTRSKGRLGLSEIIPLG